MPSGKKLRNLKLKREVIGRRNSSELTHILRSSHVHPPEGRAGSQKVNKFPKETRERALVRVA